MSKLFEQHVHPFSGIQAPIADDFQISRFQFGFICLVVQLYLGSLLSVSRVQGYAQKVDNGM